MQTLGRLRPARGSALNSLLCGFGISLAVTAAAAEPVLQLQVGSAEIIRGNLKVRTVVIGNPGVAEVAVVNENIVTVTARSPGWTNVILLDALGTEVMRREVRVTSQRGWIRVYSGPRGLTDWMCTPEGCNGVPEARNRQGRGN